MAQRKFSILLDYKTAGVPTVQAELNSLAESVKASTNLGISEESKTRLQQDLQKVSSTIAANFNKNTGEIDFTAVRSQLKAMDIDVNGLQGQLKSMGIQGSSSLNMINRSAVDFSRELEKTDSIFTKMGQTLFNTFKWNVASNALRTISGSLRQAYYFAKDLDRSLNKIQIVSSANKQDMVEFAKYANEAARELATSTTQFTDAALIYFQQGLALEAVKEMTEATQIGANITGQSVAEMSELMTSVINGYQLASTDAMMVTDKLAAVGATTASNFYELATGMSKVASMANAAGIPIDQLNAQLATIISVTREAPESIGTSLKTILGRMLMFRNNATTMMADEDGEMFGAPAVESALRKFNEAAGTQLSLFDQLEDGSRVLRNMGVVIEEIGDAWQNTMDKEIKFGLATALAGSRQQNRLVALFDSWDMYKNAVETSADAQGTALRQQETALESYDAKLRQLRASAEEIYMQLFSADDLKPIVEGFTSFLGILASFLEKIGNLSAIFPMLIAGFAAITVQATGIGKAIQSFSYGHIIQSQIKMTSLTGEVNERLRIQQDLRSKLNTIQQTGNAQAYKSAAAMSEEIIRLNDEIVEQGSLISEKAIQYKIVQQEVANYTKQTEALGHLMRSLPEKGGLEDPQKVAELESRIEALRQSYESMGLKAPQAFDKIASSIKNKSLTTKELTDIQRELTKAVDANNLSLKEKNDLLQLSQKGLQDQKVALEQQIEAERKAAVASQMARTAIMTTTMAVSSFAMSVNESSSATDYLAAAARTAVPMIMMKSSALFSAAAGAGSLLLALKAILAILGPILIPIALVAGAFFLLSQREAEAEKALRKTNEALKESKETLDGYRSELSRLNGLGRELTDSEKARASSLEIIIKKQEDLNEELERQVALQEALIALDEIKSKREKETADLQPIIAYINELEEIEQRKRKAAEEGLNTSAYDLEINRLNELIATRKGMLLTQYEVYESYEDLEKAISSYSQELEETSGIAYSLIQTTNELKESEQERIEVLDEMASGELDLGEAVEKNTESLKRVSKAHEDAVNLYKSLQEVKEAGYKFTKEEILQLNELGRTLGITGASFHEYNTELTEGYDLLTEVLKNNSEGSDQNIKSVERLIELYPELRDSIRQNEGVWEIEEKAILSLKGVTGDLRDEYIAAQERMSSRLVEESLARLNIRLSEFKGVKSLAEAYQMLNISAGAASILKRSDETGKDVDTLWNEAYDRFGQDTGRWQSVRKLYAEAASAAPAISALNNLLEIEKEIEEHRNRIASSTTDTKDPPPGGGGKKEAEELTEAFRILITEAEHLERALSELGLRRRMLEAELSLAESDEERLAILEKIIEKTKLEIEYKTRLKQIQDEALISATQLLSDLGVAASYDQESLRVQIDYNALKELEGELAERALDLEKQINGTLSQRISLTTDIVNLQRQLQDEIKRTGEFAKEALADLRRMAIDSYRSQIQSIRDQMAERDKFFAREIEAVRDRIAALREANEIEDDNLKKQELALAIQRARERLDRVMNERNVRILTEDGWEWIADPKEVEKSHEEIERAEIAHADFLETLRRKAAVKELEQQIKDLQEKQKKEKENFEKRIKRLEGFIKEVEALQDKSYEEQLKALESHLGRLEAADKASFTSRLAEARAFIEEYNRIMARARSAPSAPSARSSSSSIPNDNVRVHHTDGSSSTAKAIAGETFIDGQSIRSTTTPALVVSSAGRMYHYQGDGQPGVRVHEKPPGFATGGIKVGDGLAYLHNNERVLSERQTKSFEKLVGQLPSLMNVVKNSSPAASDVSNSNVYNLNNVTIKSDKPDDFIQKLQDLVVTSR